MADDRWIRASDQDREDAADLLSEAYAVGRLNREELDERATAVYSARTWGELRDLTPDVTPAAARIALPSVAGASRLAPRGSRTGRPARPARIYALILVVSLCVLVAPLAPWMTIVLMHLALLWAALGTRDLLFARCLPRRLAESVHQQRREDRDDEDPGQYQEGVSEWIQVAELRRRDEPDHERGHGRDGAEQA